MDLNSFKARITKTPLLTTEKKRVFCHDAENYTPELRSKMIAVLEKNELKLLKFGEKRLQSIHTHKSALQLKEVITHSKS